MSLITYHHQDMIKLFLFVLILLVGGCGTERASPQPQDVKPAETEAQRLQRLWARSCALCHVDGTGGAPKIGNHADWGERLAKGREVLIRNTVEGMNDMPPLGYCMACSEDDFGAMIDLMTQGIPAVSEVLGEVKE